MERAEDMTTRMKAGLGVALILALLKFGLIPVYEWQNQTCRNIEVLRKKVLQKEALKGNEKRLNALLLKADKAYGETARFYYQDFPNVQSLQLKLQKETERLLSSLDIKTETSDWLYPSKGAIVQAPIKIMFKASPEQIMRFLSAIEGSGHFLSVDQLKITSQQGRATLIARFDISAYGVKGKE